MALISPTLVRVKERGHYDLDSLALASGDLSAAVQPTMVVFIMQRPVVSGTDIPCLHIAYI